MPSYIFQNRKTLSKQHYIRNATTESHWFDFTESKLKAYVRQFGDDFCLVVNGSNKDDDAWVMPYRLVKHFFTEKTIRKERDRWMGTIQNDSIITNPGHHTLKVSEYHNAFYLLKNSKASLSTTLPLCADLIEDKLPDRVATTVSRILRDTAMVKRLKKKYDFSCQFCGESLKLPDGYLYCEAHHIRPLGSPHNGPDRESNLVIVCPNHHVLLDYGAISISKKLFILGQHSISQAHIEYHNANIYKVLK